MIRDLTLNEWFLNYQLQYIDKKGVHLPGSFEVDLTKLLEKYPEESFPFTTIVIKAASVWQKRYPEVNSQVIKSIFGKKVYSSKEQSVNVPVFFNTDYGPYTSAVVIDDAKSKTIDQLKDEIKEFVNRDPKTLPVGKLIVGKKNTFFNRLRLKFIHFIVNRFSGPMVKNNVGTVAVSSMLRSGLDSDKVLLTAKGPGAITFTLTALDISKKKAIISYSWDHSITQGSVIIPIINEFKNTLEGSNKELFAQI